MTLHNPLRLGRKTSVSVLILATFFLSHSPLLAQETLDTLPVVVACYSLEKRLWYCAAPHVPRRWVLKSTLDADSFAHEFLTRGTPTLVPQKQSADAWFENDDAEKYELLEQCVPGMAGKVLVTLYLSDGEMFDADYDRDVAFRMKKRR